MARKFGVELEMKGISADAILESVRSNGAVCLDRRHCYGTGSSNTAAWQLTYDGSVSNGYELVSPPLEATDENYAQVAAICAGLKARGATADKECGLHVHVDVADCGITSLKSLYVLWLRYERVLDKLYVARRRGNRSRYSRSNRRTLGGRSASMMNVVEAWDRNRLMGMASRYHKLNMSAMARHGTVEFRGHHGTVTPEAVEVWARLCVALVDKASTHTTKLPSILSWGTLRSLLRKLPAGLRGRVQARVAVMAQVTSTTVAC